MTKTQTAKINFLHIAPRKMRLIASTLKGLSVTEAEAQLLLRPQRAARALINLLRSAVANAANNAKLNRDKLVVVNIKVDQGPMIKRFLPRAMGRATPIQKKMSHVTIVLAESEKIKASRFVISPPTKKEKKAKTKKVVSSPKTATREIPKKERSGFFKKMFRRKSV
ncbi:MAG: 50S ribosomal protein L22 [bacterium]|nr:50S ribosomal protein L22 [bacterium]